MASAVFMGRRKSKHIYLTKCLYVTNVKTVRYSQDLVIICMLLFSFTREKSQYIGIYISTGELTNDRCEKHLGLCVYPQFYVF